jgi:hypothetical protein
VLDSAAGHPGLGRSNSSAVVGDDPKGAVMGLEPDPSPGRTTMRWSRR